jgi:hypothetical protein
MHNVFEVLLADRNARLVVQPYKEAQELLYPPIEDKTYKIHR